MYSSSTPCALPTKTTLCHSRSESSATDVPQASRHRVVLTRNVRRSSFGSSHMDGVLSASEEPCARAFGRASSVTRSSARARVHARPCSHSRRE